MPLREWLLWKAETTQDVQMLLEAESSVREMSTQRPMRPTAPPGGWQQIYLSVEVAK